MNLAGGWRIVEMDRWDAEAIDLLGPGSIQFGADRTGSFRFIAGRQRRERSRQRSWLGGAGGGRVVAWTHLLPPW
jgi:hypothetical protein